MANIWLTSDTHFGHHNIIAYAKRPFKSVGEMDAALIERWNSVVKPQDHIYHLGDVTMERGGAKAQERLIGLIQSLQGHKRLIMGNHDHFPVEVYLRAGFEKVRGTGRWMERMWFSHFPIHPNSMGSALACVHGHIHEAPSPPAVLQVHPEQGVLMKPYINVCVEHTNYTPIHLEDVKRKVTSCREAQ